MAVIQNHTQTNRYKEIMSDWNYDITYAVTSLFGRWVFVTQSVFEINQEQEQ
jgi:hypothetical protein